MDKLPKTAENSGCPRPAVHIRPLVPTLPRATAVVPAISMPVVPVATPRMAVPATRPDTPVVMPSVAIPTSNYWGTKISVRRVGSIA
jgi:hypothetical protein